MKKNKYDFLVSVALCEHNTKIEYLRQAVYSILNQTYSNFELIIVDDCSTTNFYNEDFMTDKRIRVIKNKQNIGLAKSRNIALENSKGKYVFIMDTDDICDKKRFEKQIDYMEKHKNVVCAGTWVRLFGLRNIKQKYRISDTEFYRCCLFFSNSPTITNPSAIIRNDIIRKYNLHYDGDLYTAEDYDMWIRLSSLGDIRIIHKVLLNYRIREGQMSQIYRSKDKNDNSWKIYLKQLNKLGYKDIDKDEEFLRKHYLSKSITLCEYEKWIKKILIFNCESHCFDKKKFNKRCFLQLKQKFYNSSLKDQFELIKGATFFCKIKYSLWIVLRPFNLFLR